MFLSPETVQKLMVHYHVKGYLFVSFTMALFRTIQVYFRSIPCKIYVDLKLGAATKYFTGS